MFASAPRSARRAAANRSNALKSTGPRTPGGKARSALNALKHGGFAAPLARIPGEDPAELAAFVGEVVEDLAPATAVERGLADRVAHLSWRRRRLASAEEELLERLLGAEDEEDLLRQPFYPDDRNAVRTGQTVSRVILAGQFDGADDPALLRLIDHDRRLCGSIDAALRTLWRAQDRRAKREREGPPAGNEPNDDRGERDELLKAWIARRGAPDGGPPVDDSESLKMDDDHDEGNGDPAPAQNEPNPEPPEVANLDDRRAPAQNEPNVAATPDAPAGAPRSRRTREPRPSAAGATAWRDAPARNEPNDGPRHDARAHGALAAAQNEPNADGDHRQSQPPVHAPSAVPDVTLSRLACEPCRDADGNPCRDAEIVDPPQGG